MNGARLCAILQDPSFDVRGRAGAILSESSTTTEQELELAFTVALRAGATDHNGATLLLAHLQQITPWESAEWRDDGEIAALRKQVAELSAEAESAAASAPDQHDLQQKMASLQTHADNRGRELTAVRNSVMAAEDALRALDEIVAEEKR